VIILPSYFADGQNKNWAFVTAGTERQTGVPYSEPMAPRKKTLEELRREAIAELERRGYDVRGKTPTQIKRILRRRPTKPKSDATPPARG
jgi:hypothetical protein